MVCQLFYDIFSNIVRQDKFLWLLNWSSDLKIDLVFENAMVSKVRKILAGHDPFHNSTDFKRYWRNFFRVMSFAQAHKIYCAEPPRVHIFVPKQSNFKPRTFYETNDHDPKSDGKKRTKHLIFNKGILLSRKIEKEIVDDRINSNSVR